MQCKLYFNNKIIPPFVKVTNIDTQLLPNIENKQKVVPNVIGAKDTGTNLGTRSISIVFKIKKVGMIKQDILNKLLEWVRGNNFKESKLQLPNMKNDYYMAKVNSEIKLSNNKGFVTGTIDFICLNPCRILENPRINTSIINYLGNEETFPTLYMTISKACNEVKVNIVNDIYNNYIKLKGNFNAGDKIIVNMKTKKVEVNNKVNMAILTLDSRFHGLVAGVNTYSYTTANHNLEVKYNDLYI